MKRLASALLALCILLASSCALAWDEAFELGSTVTDCGTGLTVWAVRVDDWSVTIIRDAGDGAGPDSPVYAYLGTSSGLPVVDFCGGIYTYTDGSTSYEGLLYSTSSGPSPAGDLVYAIPEAGTYHCDGHCTESDNTRKLWPMPQYIADALYLSPCEDCCPPEHFD